MAITMGPKQVVIFNECLNYYQQYKVWPPLYTSVALKKTAERLSSFWLFVLLGGFSLSDDQVNKILNLDSSAFDLMKTPYCDDDKESWIVSCNEAYRVSRNLPTRDEWINNKISECIEHYRKNKFWPQSMYLGKFLHRIRTKCLPVSPDQYQALLDVDKYVLDENDNRRMFDRLIDYYTTLKKWPKTGSDIGRWFLQVKRGKIALEGEYCERINSLDPKLKHSMAIYHVVKLKL